MTNNHWKAIWKNEEKIAHIHGWDFSHIDGRCEEAALPWDYRAVIDRYRTDDMCILDYDTGGGEFLLFLNHPFRNTAATEGYTPNVQLCRETLLPRGIDFRPCDDPAKIPFPDESFDMLLNRHGDFDAREVHRLLKKGGLFITQQVGCDNDRDLVDMVLPGLETPFPQLHLQEQVKVFEAAGFELVEKGEAHLPIRFYDVGAFVWFARVIPWEFTDFSVDKCYEKLLDMQKSIEEKGFVEGTIHRYLMVARK